MENDPLEKLILPHSVIELLKSKGMLVKPKFTSQQEREAGKFAIYCGKTRLRKLHETFLAAQKEIDRIVGDKKQCLRNKHIFSIKELS